MQTRQQQPMQITIKLKTKRTKTPPKNKHKCLEPSIKQNPKTHNKQALKRNHSKAQTNQQTNTRKQATKAKYNQSKQKTSTTNKQY